MESNIQELALAFAKYIPILAGTAGIKNTRFLTGTVTVLSSDDEDNRICTVKSILDGEEVTYEGVNLSPERNDGIIEVPAINSTVFFARMPDGESYVLKCSDISRWIVFIDGSNKFVFDSNGFVWNGGTLGGMAKTPVLKTKYNNLENNLNNLRTAINGWVPAANDGGAALKVALTTWLTQALTLTTQVEIEDNKIQH